MSNINSLLDCTLDDLADMPSTTHFPNGVHKVTINFVVDDVKSSVQLQLTYIEPLELSDPTAAAPTPGDKNSVFFFLKKKDGSANTYAQGGLKEILLALKSNFPGSTSKDIMQSANGAEVAVVTKIRLGKGDYEGKDNLDIVKLLVI